MYTPYKGFTLIELLVTVAIIGILATLGTAAYNLARQRAQNTKAMADLVQLRTAITEMAIDTDQWPNHQLIDDTCVAEKPPGCIFAGTYPCCDVDTNELCDDGCANAISSAVGGISATDGNYRNWQGPYIANIPADPWGNEYFFDSDYHIDGDIVPVIGSYGPNGQGNNDYDADDIILILTDVDG